MDVVFSSFIPIKPPGLNGPKGLLRMHWTKGVEVKQSIHLYVLASLGQVRPRISEPVEVTCTMFYARTPRDWDNLAVAAKFPMDSLVTLGVLVDDSPKYIESMTHRQEKVKRVADEGYLIEFTPVEETQ